MQCEIKGEWVYIYSGRTSMWKEDSEQYKKDPIGKNDPFTTFHAIRLNSITGLKVDDDEYVVTIYANGHQYPIRVTFGQRNCYKINTHNAFACKLADALGLDRMFMFDLHRRNEQTALAVQRGDEEE